MVGPPRARAGEPSLTTVRVASGLTRPLFVTHAPGDTERFFIVEQDGVIRVFRSGVLATPFLDIRPFVSCCNEQGLLGLAFHPDFDTNGYFYVNYTDNSEDTVLVRYQVSGDPDVADPFSALTLLTVAQPFPNHNGGWLGFGPDDYLYMATGDGGDRDDPGNRAQTLVDQMLGKMLRIDVNGDDFPDYPLRNYAIPPNNPFVALPGAEEIWAWGLRNPWRCAFDSQTGDLYIADVGQDDIEELNIQPSSSAGGENYGWRCTEGDSCTGNGGCECFDPSHTPPVHVYSHEGTPGRCSITGGEVYRGCALPGLNGAYFFADYCSNQVWSLTYESGAVSNLIERTSELAPGGGLTVRTISSFGLDGRGEVYICDRQGGEVFRIVDRNAPDVVSADPPGESVDARTPADHPKQPYAIQLTFSGDPGCLDPVDFAVSNVGSGAPPPSVAEVQMTGELVAELRLNGPLVPRTWTTFRHVSSGSTTRVAHLPGDVDGSLTTTPRDLIALIDALNGATVRPLLQTDIDRSGVADAEDVAALLQLFTGADGGEIFLGATLLAGGGGE